jgi:uncharacterized protein involved in outer membrane biogenesis
MRAFKWVGLAVLVLLTAFVLFVVFGLGTLKGPITKAVSNATGRELIIDGKLKPVWSWVHPRFRAEKVRFANPEWADEEWMFQADAVEVTVRVLPLLMGRVVLPDVHLERPNIDLEIDEDGRKNWVMGDQHKDGGSRISVQQLTFDHGRLRFADAGRDIDLENQLATDAEGVAFESKGKYKGLDSTVKGRGGQVLGLKDASTPYPIDAGGKIGDTTVKVKGTLTNVVQLSALDLAIDLQGKTLSELYDVIGIAFPETSPYKTKGRLVKGDHTIAYEKFSGTVGESDLGGSLHFDLAGKRPFMRGELNSKVLNLADLGPLVGTDQPKESGVLPDMPFDSDRWDSIDADVKIQAGSIERPKALPLEKVATRIQMRDKVLTLEPFTVGVAGGVIAGTIRMDGQKDPIAASTTLRVKDLKLPKLFPTLEKNQASIGDINGLIELAGRGDSVGAMLGSANGKVGLFMDGGKISRFMMELVALDVWGAAKVKLEGDQPIDIHCGIADFSAKDGVLNTNVFVFDTQVVNVSGEGNINLDSEQINLKLNPEPKNRSIASLNSPLYIRGTFSGPKVSVEWKRVGAKGIAATVMGLLSPALAVLPLLKEGENKDSPCAQLIADATKSTKAPKEKQQQAAAKAAQEKAEQANKDDKKKKKEPQPATGATRKQQGAPAASEK